MSHDSEPYKIPDYTIYKVEDVPLLHKTQQALQAQGLSDPWLRNEVWRYSPTYFGTEKRRFLRTFFTGFPTGLVATILTVAGTYAYQTFYAEKKEPTETQTKEQPQDKDPSKGGS